MRVNKILRVFAYILLISPLIATTIFAESTNQSNYTSPNTPSFDNTKSQEIIFKTPESLKTDASKLEYKAQVGLPENNAWNLVSQQESTSQFNPKLIKKDDSNYLSILATNQFPTQTIRVVIDKIDLVDIDARFYRIPNFRTEAVNDYVYLPKSTTQLVYKPTAEEVKSYDPNNTSTIYLTNSNGRYTLENPSEKEYQVAMIQEKIGTNDWNFAKQLQVNLTASTPENVTEADTIVKGSNFDNQNAQLVAPAVETAKGNTPNTPSAPTVATPNPTITNPLSSDFNIIPLIATLAGFGILNLGIRQYFKKD
jgi:hypothetical protein